MTKSQFNYCVLVWMFCSRQSNNLMNKVHERGLRLTHRDETKDFQKSCFCCCLVVDYQKKVW